ncbi:MAG: hypothetical protein NVSMB12_00630 [Acidimicrobiales bacterium]
MADEDCPHGLDREWCSLCRQAASGAPPPGVKLRAAPKRPSSPRAPRSSAPRPSASPSVALTPSEALAKVRKVMFHATAYGGWESIAESGLRTAEQILGDVAPARCREDDVVREAPAGGTYAVREQRLMARGRIEDHLDGLALPEWLALLNRRAYFFAQQKDLTTHLGRYQHTVGQDVLVFDTARLLRAAPGRVEVTTVSPTQPDGFGRCRCRGADTFVPLAGYRGAPAEVVELTVVDGLESVEGLVGRVVRYHPGGAPEVIVG